MSFWWVESQANEFFNKLPYDVLTIGKYVICTKYFQLQCSENLLAMSYTSTTILLTCTSTIHTLTHGVLTGGLEIGTTTLHRGLMDDTSHPMSTSQLWTSRVKSKVSLLAVSVLLIHVLKKNIPLTALCRLFRKIQDEEVCLSTFHGCSRWLIRWSRGWQVAALGILYDFTGNNKNTTVQKVEDMVKEAWAWPLFLFKCNGS